MHKNLKTFNQRKLKLELLNQICKKKNWQINGLNSITEKVDKFEIELDLLFMKNLGDCKTTNETKQAELKRNKTQQKRNKIKQK